MYASVILDIPTQALDSAYTYALTPETAHVRVGCAVLVPFGGRPAVGYVVSLTDETPANVARVKQVESVLSDSYFDEAGAQLAFYLSDRYIAPLSSCVRLLLPPGATPKMKRVAGSWEVLYPKVQQVDERWAVRLPAADQYEPRRSAVKQIAILEALKQGDLRVAELTAEYGSVSSVLKALESKGVVAIEERRRVRGNAQISPAFAKRIHERPELTSAQRDALELIGSAQQRADGEVIVLDGVTGSGKTEVFLCAIEEELKRGRNAIVLVPEISLTPQTVARFRGRFGDTVAVLHSRMSPGERFDQWDLIHSGAIRVVVGARSALFAPLANVGMIIVDEEHEGSYKQDQSPRYVTRDVAEWIAKRNGATLILGSATPSIEALYRVESDKDWHLAVMGERANGKPLPSIQVVDMAREFGGGNRKMFSKALQAALNETLDKNEKAVLLLNQRGFAQFLLCRDCGYVPECDSCSTSLTFHEEGNRLVCHHCGQEQPAPAVCPECGSPYLKRFGAGTQRVEAELRAFLQDRERPVEIVRMDADTTAHKGDHQRLLEQFAKAEAAVLLGTQMIAKGLDFDDVTLVGVINADTMLHLPDFRSSERTFDLIEQVAGRSGRADLPGKVIVQTYSAQEVAVRSAARYDREGFLEHELKMRKDANYPPYVRLANVLIWGERESEVIGVAQKLFFDLMQLAEEQGLQGVQVYPPTPCVLSRLKKNYRYHILIKAQPECDISAFCREYFRTRKPDKTVNVSIDIDPVSVL
ncbi:replication restart helicase PriA [Anaerotardibacter muris]|uniref:replication restart helicase PriA n=1 Tax=Anaerotardibacter muris TaxID=2941505 RepID=UPI00203CF252|nr:primosomal protein N' [Anaerotardibacter muris]